ncbi:MAG TPA: alpha/beta fold hydrolase [Anaerolineae bacterium]|nr:alpha/beta fold hydrolase [Anaerolineae bacterium]
MSDASFSFQELREANKVELARVESLTASDGVTLAYRRYAPIDPRAALVFYHGGGAHSGAGYQFLGHGLQAQFNVAVYMPDIRGHGASGGPRGDAPAPQQVWEDITTFIKHIRAEYPEVPLFLGGHSSGAALALNYASQVDHELVAGYVFLSPQLGSRAHIDRPALAAPFATVDGSAFAANAMSGGLTHGHDYAVRFNYPPAALAADPGLVAAITVDMSNALMPTAPDRQFAALDRPFGLWIGAADELFLPDKVVAFADLATAVRADSEANMIPTAKHLSILVNAHEAIGPWLIRLIAEEKI